MKGITSILTTFFIFLSSISLSFADGLISSQEKGWPQWRGLQRNGISSEGGLLENWPSAGPKLLWKTEKLGKGWSSPILQNGIIYITGDVDDELVIFALDENGKLLWKANNGRSWKKSYPGARACVTISEGKLYHVNAHGRVACFDQKKGEELWSFNMLERFQGKNGRWAISENLLIDGNHLIVTPVGRKALVAALDKNNGKVLWTSPPLPGENIAYCSPILFTHKGRRLIANYTAPHAWIIDANNGKLIWKTPLKSRWGAAVSTPLYFDQSIFFTAPDGPGGSMFQLNKSGAKLKWKTKIDTLNGSCLYINGRLYAKGCKETSALHAIEGSTGRSLFELPSLNSRKPKYSNGAMVWADQRIYALFEDGHVALLNPGENRFKTEGLFKLIKTRKNDAWTHPVILNRKLYLRYHDKLWCYDIAK